MIKKLLCLLWLILILFASEKRVIAQQLLRGYVLDAEDGQPLQGASLKLLVNEQFAYTNINGFFSVELSEVDTIQVVFIGYDTVTLPVSLSDTLVMVRMSRASTQLEVVEIQTGYYRLNSERTTGSFANIDNKLFNRGVSTDLISRLEGVTNGLLFEYPASRGAPSNTPELRIRGISSINGELQPLIVVDNFPYEGDINSINPNDVNEITVLKDAAAASIWGARAGNGVIVITTKSGTWNEQPLIAFNSNLNISVKPDLYYDRNFLSSPALIGLERELFERGFYADNDWTPHTPAVDLLFEHQKGLIVESELDELLVELGKYDIREEASRLLYQPRMDRQHALSLRGGGKKYRYYLSTGLDNNDSHVKGDTYRRLTVTGKQDVGLAKGLELSSGIFFSKSNTTHNGIDIVSLAPGGMRDVYTYARLVGIGGEALPIVKRHRYSYVENAQAQGLLDWHYRPIDERNLNDNTSKAQEIRFNTAINYAPIDGATVEIRYQYQHTSTENRTHYPATSFYARDLVNTFTQLDGTTPIPIGGIKDKGGSVMHAHYGRVQANYDRHWLGVHQINLLTGFEMRQEVTQGNGTSRLYGYDNATLTHSSLIDYRTAYPTRPYGSARISYPVSSGSHFTDRFVSYYGNVAYSYKNRYVFSGSIRWDASNIFGVRFGQKGVPLWSVGVAYPVHNQPFLASFLPLTELKLRLTYGVNGNSLRTYSSLPVVSYGATNPVTGLPMGRLMSAGNPDLRWERVGTFNAGLDLGLWENRLRIGIEWFNKRSTDLIGEDFFDPTTGIIHDGFSSYNMDARRNYASMVTKGLDIELRSLNVNSNFKWSTTLLFNYAANTVTNYRKASSPNINNYFNALSPPVVEGVSRYQLYALPWNGLDETGAPKVEVNGVLGTDYNTFFNGLQYQDLLHAGLSVPPYVGSIRNEISWRKFVLSLNVTYKGGHVFRRNSIEYGALMRGLFTHVDYLERWKQSGDEHRTNVPSMPEMMSQRRDDAYSFSELLFEHADHIRLNDVQIAYELPQALTGSLGLSVLRIYGYARNLGVIWKRTDLEIDPDTRAMYPKPKQFALGVQINF